MKHPDGATSLQSPGVASIDAAPLGLSFRPISFKLQSAHTIRIVGHPLIRGHNVFLTVRLPFCTVFVSQGLLSPQERLGSAMLFSLLISASDNCTHALLNITTPQESKICGPVWTIAAARRWPSNLLGRAHIAQVEH